MKLKKLLPLVAMLSLKLFASEGEEGVEWESVQLPRFVKELSLFPKLPPPPEIPIKSLWETLSVLNQFLEADIALRSLTAKYCFTF